MTSFNTSETTEYPSSAHSATIGVIVPNLLDSFFAACADAISSVVKQHGYSVVFAVSAENSYREQQRACMLMRGFVDGVVVISASDDSRQYIDDAFRGVHMVSVEAPLRDSHCDSIVVPNRSGAKNAVEHLIGHGHRSIAFLGLNHNQYTMRARYAGYREAMCEAGLSVGKYSECGTPEEAVALISLMMNRREPPTAVFAANNRALLCALRALNTMGLQVPQQIAVVGFDDFELAEILAPSLTVVRQPVYQLGEAAAELLLERITGGKAPKTGRRVVLPIELIVRSSCGCKPHSTRRARKKSNSQKNGSLGTTCFLTCT